VFEGLAKAMFTPQQLGPKRGVFSCKIDRSIFKSQPPFEMEDSVQNLVLNIHLGRSLYFSMFCFLCFGVDRFSFPALWILLRWEDFGMDDNMANREMPGTEIDPMQSQKPPQRQKHHLFQFKRRLCSISDVGFMVPQYSIDS